MRAGVDRKAISYQYALSSLQTRINYSIRITNNGKRDTTLVFERVSLIGVSSTNPVVVYTRPLNVRIPANTVIDFPECTLLFNGTDIPQPVVFMMMVETCKRALLHDNTSEALIKHGQTFLAQSLQSTKGWSTRLELEVELTDQFGNRLRDRKCMVDTLQTN